MKKYYQVYLKKPFSCSFSGNITFDSENLVLSTTNPKKAFMFAYEKYENERGHEFPLLRNCYVVVCDDKEICTFGYHVVKRKSDDKGEIK